MSNPISEQLLRKEEERSEEEHITPPEKRHWVLRILKIFIWSIFGLFFLLVALTGLLYVPSVQQYIVDTTLSKLESSIGYNIKIGKVEVGFPLKLKIKDVKAVETLHQDTVATVSLLTANISPIPLFQGESLPVGNVVLDSARINYISKNDSLRIIGEIGTLSSNSLLYHLSENQLRIDDISLKNSWANILVLHPPTPEEDESSPTSFSLKLGDVSLENVSGTFSMSKDSSLVEASISKGTLHDGNIDLRTGIYQAKMLDLDVSLHRLPITLSYLPYPWKIHLKGETLLYGGANNISGFLENIDYTVGDGWGVHKVSGTFEKNKIAMVVSDLSLCLPNSKIRGNFTLPFNLWKPDSIGTASLYLESSIFPLDLERFIGGVKHLPKEQVYLSLKGQGAIEKTVSIRGKLKSSSMVDLTFTGKGTSLFTKQQQFQSKFSLKTSPRFNKTILGIIKNEDKKPPSFTLPSNLSLLGKADYNLSGLALQLTLNSDGGSLSGQINYDPIGVRYKADLNIKELDLSHFLPKDSVGLLTGLMQIEGNGKDLYSPKTYANAYLNIDSLHYKKQVYRGVTLLGELKKNHFFAALDANHKALKINTLLNASLLKENVEVNINMYVDTIIPSLIGFDTPIIKGGKFELRTTLQTDFNERYQLDGEVENFYVQTDKNLIHPTNTYLKANINSQSLEASITSGDLALKFSSSNGLKDFSERIKNVVEEVKKTFQDTVGKKINMAPWMQFYPDMQLSLSMERNNLLRSYLDQSRIGAKRVRFSLKAKQGKGLSGEGFVKSFQKDTLRIDDLDITLNQDSSFFYVVATAHKERFRNQNPFDVLVSLTSNLKRSEAIFQWMDHQQKDFFKVGLELWSQPNGDLKLGFTPDPIILAYNSFVPQKNGYILFPKSNPSNIQANLLLEAGTNSFIRLFNKQNEEGNDLRATLKNIHLSGLNSVPFLPKLSGTLNAELQWLQKTSESAYNINASVQNLLYTSKPIGTWQIRGEARQTDAFLNASAQLLLGDTLVANASYYSPLEKNTPISTPRLSLLIQDFPLAKINPFLPSKYAQLEGTTSINLSNYNVQHPITEALPERLQGKIIFNNTSLFVPEVNETYTLDSKPINIKDDKLFLDGFKLFANNSPLSINGNIGLSDKLPLQINLWADNFPFLDAQEKQDNMLYGKVIGGVNLSLTGPAYAIKVAGTINVYGDTNVTYRSTSSELSGKNRYNKLVSFTDFGDTLFVKKKVAIDSLTLGAMTANLALHIDPASKVTAYLTKDEKNMVSIRGGGDLNFAIPQDGVMQLTGQYSITDGFVNIEIAPFSRKFIIDHGSRLTWNGELLKPNIDFRATYHLKSRVAPAGEEPRTVAFDVSILAENSIDDLKLRFETKAPEDAYYRNQLMTITEQEQTRYSLMLLTTGQIIGEDFFKSSRQSGQGKSSDLLNNMLTSFFASQLNSFANEALNARINLDVSDETTAAGRGTNYSYSIAKSFFNDRITVVVGGKVMTGGVANNVEQTFIDNMSLDYRLDKAGSQYLRLFHKKNYENLLDGEVVETGIGYVIRRRIKRLKDLFIFKTGTGEAQPSQQPANSNEK